MATLTVTHLTSFAGKKILLQDFSYTFEPRKIYCIVGESGAGKTTLVEHLAGFRRTIVGQIRYGAYSLGLGQTMSTARTAWGRIKQRAWRPRHLKQWHALVQLTPQFPEAQLFRETVLRDVMFGPENFGHRRATAEAMAQDALRSLRVPTALWERSPHQLSDGQKRRVALAGTFAIGSEVLLLDEPLAGLDPGARRDLVAHLKAHPGIVIIVTHDYDVALEIGDEILWLRDGRLVASGSPFTVLPHLPQPPRLTTLIAQIVRERPDYAFLAQAPIRTLTDLVHHLQEVW